MVEHKSDRSPFRLFHPWERVPEMEHLPERTRFEIWERANAASRIGCLATTICFVWFFFLLDGFVLKTAYFCNTASSRSFSMN